MPAAGAAALWLRIAEAGAGATLDAHVVACLLGSACGIVFRSSRQGPHPVCKRLGFLYGPLQECLEDHIEKSGFSNTCKTTLEEVIAQRVADFRLDAGLQVRWRRVLRCAVLHRHTGLHS